MLKKLAKKIFRRRENSPGQSSALSAAAAAALDQRDEEIKQDAKFVLDQILAEERKQEDIKVLELEEEEKKEIVQAERKGEEEKKKEEDSDDNDLGYLGWYKFIKRKPTNVNPPPALAFMVEYFRSNPQ